MAYHFAVLKKEDLVTDVGLVRRLNGLLSRLTRTGRRVDATCLEDFLASGQATVVVVRHDKSGIVGMGTICPLFKLGVTECEIHDVVIDLFHQRRGLAKELMTRLLVIGFEFYEAERVSLTSSAERKAANLLYQGLGFKRHDTNLYYLNNPKCPK